MNDTVKTSVFVGVAAVLTIAAAVASIPRVASVEEFRDQGEAFFPDFTDPDLCTSLEVTEIDPVAGISHPFKVTKADGRWAIPSHFGYPADAKDRLANTAAQVLGLKKDTVRSSRSEDHAKLGVLDPTEIKSVAQLEGVGKRITLRDKSDRVLADFILGKDVPGRPGQKFVRRPDQARTYGVNVKAEPSTSFADWIEPNLLDIEGSNIRLIDIDNRKIDEDRMEIIPGEQLKLDRTADGAPWTTPGLSPKDEVDPTKMATMVRNLSDLKIVGVRPKPNGLADYLIGKSKDIDRAAQLSLAANGFHAVRGGGLLSGEGSVIVGLSDGVSLNMRFGRVTFAQGEALSAGTGDQAKDGKDAKDEKKDKPKEDRAGVESRYLFVQASFDPALVNKPKPRPAPRIAPGALPKNVFQRPGSEIAAELAPTKAEEDAYRKRLEDGKARVELLSKRFAPWYYLVPGDAYRSIIMDRKALVRVKPPEGAPGPGNPSLPGGGLPFSLPGRGGSGMPSPHGQ